ncbi:MAG: hypothetical protein K2U26_12000 [Cyclobacteriaceae bacterium]|nr:hypothetical protein [Cyclobacteriaceae bacterium]
MKKLITLLFITSTLVAKSQTVEEAIKTTLTQWETAADQTARMAAVNRFGLIANKWSTEWVAHYYAGYIKTITGAIEADKVKKSQFFNEAEKSLEAAKANGASENDEVYVLLAMISSNRIGLDPEAWQKHMEVYSTNLRKAKQLRKENPRIYYIEGMSKYYTPEAYGGGKKNALIYFEKAEEYFKNETNTDIRKPYWGREQNSKMLEQCNQP